MAKIYKVIGYVVDIEGESDKSDINLDIYGTYADECISCVEVEEKDIGEWTDDNPLNSIYCSFADFEKYFKEA